MLQEGDKEAAAFREALYTSAKKSEKLKHLIIDSAAGQQALQYFGLVADDLPSILLQNAEDEKFIKKHAKPQDLAGFVSDFQVCSGTLCCMKALVSTSLQESWAGSYCSVPYTCIQNAHLDWCLTIALVSAGVAIWPQRTMHRFTSALAAQAGKLKPTIKSEEPPKDNNGPVKVVTANTFDDIVNNGNDVLIEFYAPW